MGASSGTSSVSAENENACGTFSMRWGPLGVRVNAVSPGFTRSPPFQAKIDSGERDTRALEANTALRRIMEPEDIANAVAFLMSDEASAITGVNLPVDGGWLCMQSWMSYPGVRGDWP